VAGDGAPIRFTSSILPPAKSLEELPRGLNLKGISTGDFGGALAALLGLMGPLVCQSPPSRVCKDVWETYQTKFQRHDLNRARYGYLRTDGSYFNARLEEAKQYILVIIGTSEDGSKKLEDSPNGYQKREQSCRQLFL
jgi:hypothetical protein